MRIEIIATAILFAAAAARSHEGHAALPTRGAKVDLEKGTIVLSRESRDALGVETAEIAAIPTQNTSLAYVALVSPWKKHAFASSRLPGRVVALLSAPGKFVSAGETLAELESMELENLQEELLRAQTERRLAERLLATLRQAPGAVAGHAVLDAETAQEKLRSAEIVGRMKWRSLGLEEDDLDAFLADSTKRLRRLAVSAPIRGAVVHVDVAVGGVVEPGEHLFEVVDRSSVWTKVGVLERDLERIEVGVKADIRLSARPNESRAVEIEAVAPILDGPGMTLSAWATIRNASPAEPQWLPGMTGRARLVHPPTRDAKAVPGSALIDDGLSQYVLVEEAQTQKQSEYRRKDVVVVRKTPHFVDVRSPQLFPGDRVVVRGARQLGGFFVPTTVKLTAEAATTMGLKTGSAQRRRLEHVLELDGTVELAPDAKAVAVPRLSGNVLRIHADRGRQVHRGDLLAEVQSVEFQSLQLDLIREHLSLKLAERRLESIRMLGDPAPQRLVLEAEAAVLSARNRTDTLRRRLTAVGLVSAQVDGLLEERRLIESLPVLAPMSGVVATFDKVIGQSVRGGEPIFSVVDPSRALVKAWASERDADSLVTGQTVRVRFAANPERIVPGRIAGTAGVFSTENQAQAVWIDLQPSEAGPPRPGQRARATVVLHSSPDAPSLAVERTALIAEAAERAFVFVRKADGAFERRPVVVGRSDDRFVEIRSGLQGRETIAVQGVRGLATAHASIR